MPVPRTEVAGAGWQGGIVAAGGFLANGTPSNRADVYTADDNQWRRLPDLPIGLHHAAALGGDRVVVVGGYTNDNAPSGRVFSLAEGGAAWSELAPLSTPRGAHVAAMVGGRMVVAGGVVNGAATNSTAVLDNGVWREGPPLARAREHLAATVAGGRMYVIAGRVGSENFTDVQSWDGVEAAWRDEPSLNDGRGGIAAATVGDRPCVAGGEEPGGTIGSVECLERGAWRRVARLARPRHGLVVVALGRDLHVIGGGRQPGLSVSGDHEVLAL